MSFVVPAIIRGLGQTYSDGVERMEIHIAIGFADHLPHEFGHRVPITMSIGGTQYLAGIRATINNPYIWICPDIKSEQGKPKKLAHVLSDAGFNKNDHVSLTVSGNSVSLSLHS